jgi:nitrogenase molybdenum-iron protein alpha/beta subunit
VAVVGNFLDRNEGDHLGNLAEMRRVTDALGLKLVSTWLDGSPTTELRQVAQAGTIISLPYARRAARHIADKTGARVVELDLPLGLKASQQWITALGAATGRRWEAKELVEAELRDTVPIVDIAVTEYLQGKRFAFNGDPFLGEAVLAAFRELGCTPAHGVIFAVEEEAGRLTSSPELQELAPLYAARMSEVLELQWSDVDFVVGNSYIHYLVRLRDARKPYVELGYPSYRQHELSHRPNWFFKGFVNLVNRVINEL